jgi:hypothetical protein
MLGLADGTVAEERADPVLLSEAQMDVVTAGYSVNWGGLRCGRCIWFHQRTSSAP